MKTKIIIGSIGLFWLMESWGLILKYTFCSYTFITLLIILGIAGIWFFCSLCFGNEMKGIDRPFVMGIFSAGGLVVFFIALMFYRAVEVLFL